MRKPWVLALLLSLAATVPGCGIAPEETQDILEITYEMTDIVVQNPYIGFAVEATNTAVPEEHSLVYMDITFAELQPEGPDHFDFSAIEKKHNLPFWKARGKHAVLRFLCDRPGDQPHMDIPGWLYDLTGDGDFYDTSYGKGYSPDYSSEVFLLYHQKAIAALGAYFSDGFVRYVQLGSLGHWGEWHVLYSAGIKRLPDSNIREQYVQHYADAFPYAKLMMRRPFAPAAQRGFGLYNDMSGHAKSTREWLNWIENGGTFTQTREPDALQAMPDFWKTAPSGGEFTSSLPMYDICILNLRETLSLLRQSHISFLGPKCPVSNEYGSPLYRLTVPKIRNALGYRIGITKITLETDRNTQTQILTLQWENHGNAPIYFASPVVLYLASTSGEIQALANVAIDLTALLPGQVLTSVTPLPQEISYGRQILALGILDSTTGQPSISLVSSQQTLKEKLFILHQFP